MIISNITKIYTGFYKIFSNYSCLYTYPSVSWFATPLASPNSAVSCLARYSVIIFHQKQLPILRIAFQLSIDYMDWYWPLKSIVDWHHSYLYLRCIVISHSRITSCNSSKASLPTLQRRCFNIFIYNVD